MRRTLLLIPLAALLAAPAARGQVKLPPIDDPNFRPYPIAVPAFKDLATGGAELAETGAAVLRSDLELTGAFKLLDPRSYLADPAKEGITSAAINFADWLNVGAEGLIKVGLAKSGDEVTLDCHLFDVATGRELLAEKYTGPQSKLRRLVHRWADAVVQHFTGVPSVFFTRITFTKKVGRNKRVCVMDFDGHNERCVVRNDSINLLPAWSADGRGLYYSSYIKGGPYLYYRDLVKGKTRIISRTPGLNIGAAASPDGKWVALTRSLDENSEIYRLAATGGSARRLTRNWSIDSSPCFSPDSKQIAFVSERSGSPQIYVMDADGSDVRRLTFQGNYNQTPDWSPRGDWILFNGRDERLVYDIFRINPDTGEIRRLTQDQGNNEHPSYSPDGNLVVFSSTRTGESKLYVMNADGTNQRLISRGRGEYTTPEWGPWLEQPE
jgi:TolB protein